MLCFYIFIFLFCFFLLSWSGNWLVKSLIRMTKFLGWKEFVVAFFVMAFAGSIPNLFVGISSALHGIPRLSFGDVVGGNVVDLTLAVAIAVLISGGLSAESRTVQVTSIFTIVIAILPLILILDGKLGRIDGILLILTFIFYLAWLFSKKERFEKIYNYEKEKNLFKRFKIFIKDLGLLIFWVTLLLISAEGIIRSAVFFAQRLDLSLAVIGILLVGLGNALPEIYFSIVSARKGQSWMILGNLMGSVVVPATLVLGIVALISPIKIIDFSPFAVGRVFLFLSAIFFFIFIRSDKKITRKEGLILLFIYIIFIIIEMLL